MCASMAKRASLNAELDMFHDVTDLTAVGHYRCIASCPVQQRTWRQYNPHDGRRVRRSQREADAKAEKGTVCGSGARCSCIKSCWCCFCCGRSNSTEQEEFHFFSGMKGFYLWVVREHPFIAMCVWALLFLCEAAIVVLYIVQTTQLDNPSWLAYDSTEFGFYIYAQTILSVVLLSQLFFAYSVSPFTIIIVLVTSGNRIITFFVALAPGLGWVSRIYIPFFLRCWPMRQYFLFLLETYAIIKPRSLRLDIIRHAAGPLSAFVALVITFSCIFHIHQVFRGFPLNIADAHYWLMETVSTVGFGDIVPQGHDGRALAIVIIFIFLACMPLWIGVIMSTLQLLRKFTSYDGRGHHFLVYGDVTREEALSILEEVITLYGVKPVCFCNKSFPRDVEAIARHPRYRLCSKFLEVDVLNNQALERLRVREADAIIILPSRQRAFTMRDDDVMLPSLVFQRGAPYVPQYLRLRFGLHLDLLQERNKRMVDQQMRRILAAALLLPGIVPFLVNLVRTSSTQGVSSATLWDEKEMDNWKGLYEYSRRNVFNTCPMPWYLAHLSLGRIVALLKKHDVLVVGIEEGARRLMRLNLDYHVEDEDTLLVLHERGPNFLENVLKRLDPHRAQTTHTNHRNRRNGDNNCEEMQSSPSETASLTGRRANDSLLASFHYLNSSEDDEDASCQDTSRLPFGHAAVSFHPDNRGHDREKYDVDGEQKETFNSSALDEPHLKLFYPFNSNFDLTELSARETRLTSPILSSTAPPAAGPAAPPLQRSRSALIRHRSIAQQDALRRRLFAESFVDKAPRNVPLHQLPLGGPLPLLLELLRSHDAAVVEPHGSEDAVERLENQVNDILDHLAGEYLHSKKHRNSGGGGQSGGNKVKESLECFLFVDQVSSFKQPAGQSLYDAEVNETQERTALTHMVQCIRSIYEKSRVTVLTSQTMSARFMESWAKTLGIPLRYIRGVSTMESHLEYALRQSGGISKLRGILVYCSQLGYRDFDDVPLITVVNNLRVLLEASGKRDGHTKKGENSRNDVSGDDSSRVTHEQHLLVEMQCFSSCISVAPYHTDVEWRRRGEEHFQDSLAFMSGRCFSTNMLQTIFIHAHYDRRILQFFEMVLSLNVSGQNHSSYAPGNSPNPTLFHLCGNQLLHFQTFGDAFAYLLSHRSWVAIGVFRRFPPTENMPGNPRYFITNPSLKMVLRPDDVMYAIGEAHFHNTKT